DERRKLRFGKTDAGGQRGDEKYTAIVHHAHGFVVEEGAVLDGIDPRANRTFGGFRTVGVSCRFTAQRVRLRHQRIEFRLAQLWDVDIIGGRKNAAAGTSLDDIRTVFDIEADGILRLFRRIDDAIFGTGLVMKQPVAKTRAVVTVAAGGAERMYGDQHARAG